MISGNYVKTFAGANLASAVGVHMNGDYHFHFDVVLVDGKDLRVRSHRTGDFWDVKITKGRDGSEHFTYQHKGMYSEIFGAKPEKIKVVPFKGVRS